MRPLSAWFIVHESDEQVWEIPLHDVAVIEWTRAQLEFLFFFDQDRFTHHGTSLARFCAPEVFGASSHQIQVNHILKAHDPT